MKRLSRQRCYVHHEKGARASRPSVVVLHAAGAKVALAVVGVRWGIGPGVVRKLDGWSRGRFTCSRKRFGTSPCFLRFPLCRLGANRCQICIRRMGSSRSRGVIARESSLLHKCFLFVDNGLLQFSQIGKTNSVVYVQDLGEVAVPGSGQSA